MQNIFTFCGWIERTIQMSRAQPIHRRFQACTEVLGTISPRNKEIVKRIHFFLLIQAYFISFPRTFGVFLSLRANARGARSTVNDYTNMLSFISIAVIISSSPTLFSSQTSMRKSRRKPILHYIRYCFVSNMLGPMQSFPTIHTSCIDPTKWFNAHTSKWQYFLNEAVRKKS